MSDPWESNDWNGLSYESGVGPQVDGTWGVPVAARPSNNPSNTAGYTSATPDWIGKLLSQGVGVLGNYYNTQAVLDYRKFEATNGGLFRQGYPALLSANGNGGFNSLILWGLILGGVFLLVRR